MKFDILDRWTGAAIVTVDIDTDSEDKSIQLRMVVQWAINNKVNLSYANLRNANLRNADLSGADLRNADLRNADLRNADLSYANLRYANLRNANLRNAYLSGADLRNADLSYANLRNANLRNADLSGADLRNADLSGANLWNAFGNLKHIKTMQIDGWPISYTATDMQIGCQRHPIDKWRKFQDKTIARMDINALAWWKIWKPIIFQIIDTSPAEPTKENEND